MAMDNRLVEWIKLQIPAGDDYVVISYDETDMFYAAMVTECRLASLIEPAVINTPDGIMTYRLTDIGKIALGIQDPATEPAATEPATVGTGDGEPVYRVELRDGAAVIAIGDTGKLAAFYRDDLETEAEICAAALNNQTRALQAELAAARERIAELTGELPSGRNDSIELSNDVAATDKLLAESEAMITKLTAENNRLQDAIDKAHSHIINAHDTIPKNINGTGYIMDALEAIEAVLPD